MISIDFYLLYDTHKIKMLIYIKNFNLKLNILFIKIFFIYCVSSWCVINYQNKCHVQYLF